MLTAHAQSDVNFAQRLGSNHYYGTARTMGMGNTVTAVGGDLGSIGINPAGSAVFNYGQIELSPGLNFSSVGAAYAPNASTSFGTATRDSDRRFTLPSVGFSLCFKTGRRTGLCNVTFAVVNNVSNNYLESFAGGGGNDGTSFFANLGAAAQGIPPGDIDSYAPYDNPDLDWAIISGYRAYMLGTVPDKANTYLGNNELLAKDASGNSYHYVPGNLRQQAEVTRLGTKNDIVFNLGFNLSDKFYFGFNLGVPYIRYSYRETYTERAVDPELFPIVFQKTEGGEYVANFNSAQYGYAYSSSTIGVYGKAGVLWRPLDCLRVGAAIQTPVAYGIKESYSNSVTSIFKGGSGTLRGDASSPVGNYDYKFTGPWRFNAGLAYTIGSVAMLSADYEMAAFRGTRYREKYSKLGDDYFSLSNEALGLFLGCSHAMRMGAEVRPLPGFAIRAGGTLSWSPERIWTDNLGKRVDVNEWYADLPAFRSGLRTLEHFDKKGDLTWSASFGLGWSSQGSFFVDAAVRYNAFPTYTYYPYLYGDYAAVDKDNQPLPDISSPRMSVSRSLWDLTVTVGWRF